MKLDYCPSIVVLSFTISYIEFLWVVWSWLYAQQWLPPLADWDQLQPRYGVQHTSHSKAMQTGPGGHTQRYMYMYVEPINSVMMVNVNKGIYRIAQNFQGRKHSRISQFWATHESFLHEIWVCPCQPMIGFSIPRKFPLRNGHFLLICEGFVPRKFPAIQYVSRMGYMSVIFIQSLCILYWDSGGYGL